MRPPPPDPPPPLAGPSRDRSWLLPSIIGPVAVSSYKSKRATPKVCVKATNSLTFLLFLPSALLGAVVISFSCGTTCLPVVWPTVTGSSGGRPAWSEKRLVRRNLLLGCLMDRNQNRVARLRPLRFYESGNSRLPPLQPIRARRLGRPLRRSFSLPPSRHVLHIIGQSERSATAFVWRTF